MTTAQMISEVKLRAGALSNVQLSSEEVIGYLNAAQKDVFYAVDESGHLTLSRYDNFGASGDEAITGLFPLSTLTGFAYAKAVSVSHDDGTTYIWAEHWPGTMIQALDKNSRLAPSYTRPFWSLWKRDLGGATDEDVLEIYPATQDDDTAKIGLDHVFVRYFVEPTALAKNDPTAVCSLSSRLHHLVVAKASVPALLKAKQPEMAASVYDRYQKDVAAINDALRGNIPASVEAPA